MSEVLEILRITAALWIPIVFWSAIAIYFCTRSRVSKSKYKGRASAADYVYRKEGNVLYRRKKVWGRSRR